MKFIEAKIYNWDLEENEETVLINVANIAWIADGGNECYIEMNYGNDPHEDKDGAGCYWMHSRETYDAIKNKILS